MRLRKIYTNHFPIKGFTAITVLLWCFVRKDCAEKFDDIVETHENIHLAQEVELLFAFFYFFYAIEWLVRLSIYRDRTKAYLSISFEQEAYTNQRDHQYLARRRPFAFVRYIGRHLPSQG